MGRSIPSVTYRVENKRRDWELFRKALPPHEQEAFEELLTVIRNRRTAIDAAEEPDIAVAMLLAIVTHLQGALHVRTRPATQQKRLDHGTQ
ncbi:hypothetical protein KJ765_02905 [Candidatus Micrarchaeota archaeon]|nr:hypothetical protein [Candidatus Micrarchaeota archaeon]